MHGGREGYGGGEGTLFVQASEWETLQQRIVRAQARWALHREALASPETRYGDARAEAAAVVVKQHYKRQAKRGGRNGSST